MNLLKTYISIRLRQAYRMAKDAGWLYVLVLSPMALVLLFGLLERSQNGSRPDTAIAFLILVGFLHFNRKDHDFLSRLRQSPFILRSFDYLLLAIPFLVGLLILGCFKDAAIILLGIPLLGAIKPIQFANRYRSGWGLKFIPLQAFEWRAGIRQYSWLLLIFYIPGLLASQFTAAALITTIGLAFTAISYFDNLENKHLIEIFLPRRGFLKRKMYWQALVFHGFMLPHYVLFLIFHSTYWYLLLVAILAAESILLFALFYKYAHWSPSRQRAYNQMSAGFYVGGLIIPFLAPASVYYLWLYYRKAKKNIRYYYDKN